VVAVSFASWEPLCEEQGLAIVKPHCLADATDSGEVDRFIPFR
jgi:hypothetical protein